MQPKQSDAIVQDLMKRLPALERSVEECVKRLDTLEKGAKKPDAAKT